MYVKILSLIHIMFKKAPGLPKQVLSRSRDQFLAETPSRWGIHCGREEELECCSLVKSRWRDNQAEKKKETRMNELQLE